MLSEFSPQPEKVQLVSQHEKNRALKWAGENTSFDDIKRHFAVSERLVEPRGAGSVFYHRLSRYIRRYQQRPY